LLCIYRHITFTAPRTGSDGAFPRRAAKNTPVFAAAAGTQARHGGSKRHGRSRRAGVPAGAAQSGVSVIGARGAQASRAGPNQSWVAGVSGESRREGFRGRDGPERVAGVRRRLRAQRRPTEAKDGSGAKGRRRKPGRSREVAGGHRRVVSGAAPGAGLPAGRHRTRCRPTGGPGRRAPPAAIRRPTHGSSGRGARSGIPLRRATLPG
jgi:hypothetical protein